jgi:hypothetical protein
VGSELITAPGDVWRAGGREGADPDAPAQDAPQFVDLLACGVHLRSDAASPGGDRLACLGRNDAAACALEQRRAELLLEPPNLV